MINTTEDSVVISRKTWEQLRESEYYRELIEAVEDSEALREAKETADDFIDFHDYDKRRSSGNVLDYPS